jgi:hypothetical protein
MKVFRHSWGHPDVNCVRPDGVGRFQDFSNIFIDAEEYEKQKIEQTKQMEEEGKKKKEKKEEEVLPPKISREDMNFLKLEKIKNEYCGGINTTVAKIAAATRLTQTFVSKNLPVVKAMLPPSKKETYNNTTN